MANTSPPLPNGWKKNKNGTFPGYKPKNVYDVQIAKANQSANGVTNWLDQNVETADQGNYTNADGNQLNNNAAALLQYQHMTPEERLAIQQDLVYADCLTQAQANGSLGAAQIDGFQEAVRVASQANGAFPNMSVLNWLDEQGNEYGKANYTIATTEAAAQATLAAPIAYTVDPKETLDGIFTAAFTQAVGYAPTQAQINQFVNMATAQEKATSPDQIAHDEAAAAQASMKTEYTALNKLGTEGIDYIREKYAEIVNTMGYGEQGPREAGTAQGRQLTPGTAFSPYRIGGPEKGTFYTGASTPLPTGSAAVSGLVDLFHKEREQAKVWELAHPGQKWKATRDENFKAWSLGIGAHWDIPRGPAAIGAALTWAQKLREQESQEKSEWATTHPGQKWKADRKEQLEQLWIQQAFKGQPATVPHKRDIPGGFVPQPSPQGQGFSGVESAIENPVAVQPAGTVTGTYPPKGSIFKPTYARLPVYGGTYALSMSEWKQGIQLLNSSKATLSDYPTPDTAPEQVQDDVMNAILEKSYEENDGNWAKVMTQVAKGTPLQKFEAGKGNDALTDWAGGVVKALNDIFTQDVNTAENSSQKITVAGATTGDTAALQAEAAAQAKKDDPIGYEAANAASWGHVLDQISYGNPYVAEEGIADTFQGSVGSDLSTTTTTNTPGAAPPSAPGVVPTTETTTLTTGATK